MESIPYAFQESSFDTAEFQLSVGSETALPFVVHFLR
jgi:hypothetical protein